MTRFPLRRRVPRLFPLLILFGLLVGAGSASAAVKESVVITPTGVSPGFQQYGVYNFSVAFAGPDDVAAGFVAGTKVGHCVEGTVRAGSGSGRLLTGVEGADLSLANDDLNNPASMAGGRDRLEWLLLSSRRAQLDTPIGTQRDVEAAAHQNAVWRLTNPITAPNSTDPRNSDPAVVARGQQLFGASATYGPNVGQTPAIVPVGADVCSGASRTLRISGSPLTTATLDITAGQGRFTSGATSANGQQTVVMLDASGATDVTLTGSAVGTVAVRGTFERVTLVQAELPNSQINGQDFAYVEVRTVTVAVPVTFIDCTPPPPVVTPPTPGTTPTPVVTTPAPVTTPTPVVTPPAPGTTPAPVITPIATGTQNTTVRITKAAPQTARVKAAVSYGITVTNTGASAASNVIVADPVPAGMTVVQVPANARLVKGVIRWSLGDLQPGQKVTVRVLLRTNINLARSRCNVATASAGNAPSVRARICTRFVKVTGAVRIPVVTG